MGSGKGAESRACMPGVFSRCCWVLALSLLPAPLGLAVISSEREGKHVFFSNMNTPGYIFTVFGHCSAKCSVHSVYNSKYYAFKISPKLFFKCRITK